MMRRPFSFPQRVISSCLEALCYTVPGREVPGSAGAGGLANNRALGIATWLFLCSH